MSQTDNTVNKVESEVKVDNGASAEVKTTNNVMNKELSEEEKEEYKKGILKQVEFYFSKYNLPRDIFLKKQISSDPEGWVKIDVLLTFHKMRKYAPYKGLVSEALSCSQILDVEGDKIKLKPGIKVEDSAEEMKKRTVYIKNFERENWNNLNDELQAFLVEKIKTYASETDAAPESQIGRINIRTYTGKDKKKGFKGSVFVEFLNEECAKKFLNVYTKEDIVFKGATLIIMSRISYEAKKQEDERALSKVIEEVMGEFSLDRIFKMEGFPEKAYVARLLDYFNNKIHGFKLAYFKRFVPNSEENSHAYIFLDKGYDIKNIIDEFNKSQSIVSYKDDKANQSIDLKLKAVEIKEGDIEDLDKFKESLKENHTPLRNKDDFKFLIDNKKKQKANFLKRKTHGGANKRKNEGGDLKGNKKELKVETE